MPAVSQVPPRFVGMTFPAFDVQPAPDGRAGRPSAAQPEVEIRRSSRRRRTVSAYREGDRIVVLVPARLSATEEARLVAEMVTKVQRSAARRTAAGQSDLGERAERLSRRYLGGLAKPSSVRWVSNQNTRWGSCTPSRGTIRLSSRLVGMPDWVIDYVVLHELAHLLRGDHSRAFWDLLGGYERLAEAKAFLDGVAFGAGLPTDDDGDVADD